MKMWSNLHKRLIISCSSICYLWYDVCKETTCS